MTQHDATWRELKRTWCHILLVLQLKYHKLQGVYVIYLVSSDMTCKKSGKALHGRKEAHIIHIKSGKMKVFHEFCGGLWENNAW